MRFDRRDGVRLAAPEVVPPRPLNGASTSGAGVCVDGWAALPEPLLLDARV